MSKSTHVRLRLDLAERLGAVSERTLVPKTVLLDRIVEDALPRFERQVEVATNKKQDGSRAAAAARVAERARMAAKEARQEALSAEAWEAHDTAQRTAALDDEAARTAAARAKDAPKPRDCAHETVKTMTWGGRVCTSCSAVVKRA